MAKKKVKVREAKPKVRVVREISSEDGSVEQEVSEDFSSGVVEESIVSSGLRFAGLNGEAVAGEQDIAVVRGRESLAQRETTSLSESQETNQRLYSATESSSGTRETRRRTYVGGVETREEAKSMARAIPRESGFQNRSSIGSAGDRRSDIEESQTQYYAVEDKANIEREREKRKMPWER